MRAATSRRRRLATGLGGAAAVVAVAAALSSCTPITTGHIDALDVDYDGTNLTLDIRDHNLSPINDDVNPATVELHAVPASETTVPSGSAFAFLGPPGAPMWVLPQSQKAGVLWPGVDTSDIPSGVLQDDRVTIRLVGASGPGQFALYTASLGTTTVWFNSADGLPDARNFSRGTHAHANWAFRAPGTYTLTFEVVATASDGTPKTSGPIAYTFVVGS